MAAVRGVFDFISPRYYFVYAVYFISRSVPLVDRPYLCVHMKRVIIRGACSVHKRPLKNAVLNIRKSRFKRPKGVIKSEISKIY